MSLLQNSNAISAGGYSINNSLRFQSASSQYLNRTPASASNQKTWTLSLWLKRGVLGTVQEIFSCRPTVSPYAQFQFQSDNLDFEDSTSGAVLTTTQVFRDPSAWYHLVLAVDTTQATASNRVKMYVNGSQITTFSTATYPTLNANTNINSTSAHWLGNLQYASAPFDGYLSEVNFIDGQALTPSSFGETNTLTGQWVAKKYTGTYGTNGFYLPFSNGTSTTTLGADSSGNGNNWTLTNFTRSAGVSDCWMYDVPSGNGGASGTQPSSNYAVLNPLDKSSNITLSAANLNYSQGVTDANCRATIGMSSGKWYWEVTITANNPMISISTSAATISNYPGSDVYGWGYYGLNGQKYTNSTGTSYGATYTTNDVVGVAFDADNGTLTFYKNGASQGTAFTGLTNGPYFASIGRGTGSPSTSFNFGQRSFAYTPPSGFKALCTANLPASTIVKGNKYMDATLWTGDGTSSRAITNAGSFKPDFLWGKIRNTAASHRLIDSVRGVSNALYSNETTAETSEPTALLSFNSNGFTVGSGSLNVNTYTYVGWQWQAGQGTTSSNTSGSITSTVSVNATAGFSIVTYTGTGANATVGHGLGVAPKMVIVKLRSASGGQWFTYHESIGNTKYLILNTTDAATTSATAWNNTSPTSSVFTIGTNGNVNQAQNFVAYCFAAIPSFSAFGSYAGNGSSDGNFLYFGFKPKFIMIKNITTSGYGGWVMLDTSRNPYNVTNKGLAAESAGAEFTVAYGDVLSNGFKIRIVDNGVNASGQSYIYAAFAENPFSNSNAF